MEAVYVDDEGGVKGRHVPGGVGGVAEVLPELERAVEEDAAGFVGKVVERVAGVGGELEGALTVVGVLEEEEIGVVVHGIEGGEDEGKEARGVCGGGGRGLGERREEEGEEESGRKGDPATVAEE